MLEDYGSRLLKNALIHAPPQSSEDSRALASASLYGSISSLWDGTLEENPCEEDIVLVCEGRRENMRPMCMTLVRS